MYKFISACLIALSLFASAQAGEYPEGFPMLERDGYTLVYDGRFKIPYWTFEHLTKQNVEGKLPRGHFKTDKDIYKHHQSTNADYTHSGYQRGHMVPDADRDNTPAARRETYLYSNACPQEGPFNRGIWADLEDAMRDLVMVHGYDSADVYTGPLFISYKGEDGKDYVTFEVIGKHKVAVPTHFFKVVFASDGDKVEEWAYIIPTFDFEGKEYDDYEVTITDVEKASGLNFSALH